MYKATILNPFYAGYDKSVSKDGSKTYYRVKIKTDPFTSNYDAISASPEIIEALMPYISQSLASATIEVSTYFSDGASGSKVPHTVISLVNFIPLTSN